MLFIHTKNYSSIRTKITYLGFEIDSFKMMIRLMESRWSKIVAVVKKAIKK